jgi:hypothetical protein
MPENERVEGLLILSPADQLHGDQTAPKAPIVFLDLGKRNELLFSQEGHERFFRFRASPDRTQVAYIKWVLDAENSVIEEWLVIADAAGQIKATIPYQAEHWSYHSWADNQHLAIRWRAEDLSTSAGLDILWLDPLTGKEELITTPERFPGNLNFYAGLLLWEFPLVYDSSLQLLAYPGHTENGDDAIALWNVETRQDIANYPAEVMKSLQGPVWSPNESQFAFAMAETYNPTSSLWKQELFSVSRDGQLLRLTNLTSYYKQVSIDNFSWDPHGNYIAFWFTDYSGKQLSQELAVLDMKTLQVTSYCIPGDELQFVAPAPVWSPNGQQIAVENRRADGESQRIIVVDFVNKYAVQIADDMSVESWMVSTQP